MDLAKDRSFDQNNLVRILDATIRLSNLGLIGYFVWKGLTSPAVESLEEFKSIRNLMYLVYMVVLVIFGVIILSHQHDNLSFIKTQTPLSQVVPMIIISIILTTFAYAISLFILDLLKIILPL